MASFHTHRQKYLFGPNEIARNNQLQPPPRPHFQPYQFFGAPRHNGNPNQKINNPDSMKTHPNQKPNQHAVVELNHDLIKLKDQLRELAEKGDQINQRGECNTRREHQNNSGFIRNNLSAENLNGRKRQYHQELYYRPNHIQNTSNINHIEMNKLINPKTIQKPFDQHKNNLSTSQASFNLPNLSKNQQKINKEFNKTFDTPILAREQQQESKIIPINNPNKMQQKIAKNLQLQKSSIENQLRKRISNLQADLEACKIEKSNLNNQLAIQKNDKAKAIKELKDQIQKRSNYEQQIFTLKNNSKLIKDHEMEIKKLMQINEKLKFEISRLKHQQFQVETNAFNDVLKRQIEEMSQAKNVIDRQQQQINELNQQLAEAKMNIQNLENEIRIQNISIRGQIKAVEQESQLKLHEKSNEIQTLKRTLETMDIKLKSTINQIKQKDDFIIKYLVNRSKENDREEIKQIIENFKATFPKNRTAQC